MNQMVLSRKLTKYSFAVLALVVLLIVGLILWLVLRGGENADLEPATIETSTYGERTNQNLRFSDPGQVTSDDLDSFGISDLVPNNAEVIGVNRSDFGSQTTTTSINYRSTLTPEQALDQLVSKTEDLLAVTDTDYTTPDDGQTYYYSAQNGNQSVSVIAVPIETGSEVSVSWNKPYEAEQ
jgi:hypothetical protein